MKTTNLSPQQLDSQSKINIHSWVDIDSERHKEIDDNLSFTKKIIRLDFLMIDSLGRLWGKNDDGQHYPFHLEYGKKLIGLRISKRASN